MSKLPAVGQKILLTPTESIIEFMYSFATTEGKAYEVVRIGDDGLSAYVLDDKGNELPILREQFTLVTGQQYNLINY